MTSWDTYPPAYRAAETQAVLAALRAGDCISVVGLSGAGKSNFLSFLGNDRSSAELELFLADSNRMPEVSIRAFRDLLRQALGDAGEISAGQSLTALETVLDRRLAGTAGSIGILVDLSPVFGRPEGLTLAPEIAGNLRALRDAHKYRLAFAIATRHLFPDNTELSELLYGHTVWLGPLSERDSRWTIGRFVQRKGLPWVLDEVAPRLIAVSGGYPSLLRAACEAYADGSPLEPAELARHPAVAGRLAEFFVDSPSEEEIRRSGLEGLPLLQSGPARTFDPARLTAKENLLWEYLQAHPGEVCAKDDLVRAVWPEDRILEQGVRDDSLAQLVRRLREKAEADPANPVLILTVPGRGYRFAEDSKGGSDAR
jgi:hypothetical protein